MKLVFARKNSTAEGQATGILAWVCILGATYAREKTLGVKVLNKYEVEVSWSPQQAGWLALNTDGSVEGSSRSATRGGLIRNDSSHCFLAFYLNLGMCSITLAEIRATLFGLQLLWHNDYRQVALQIDSTTAV
ncbi:Putative ribonuclease H protein At1g65750 [Linum perenne]